VFEKSTSPQFSEHRRAQFVIFAHAKRHVNRATKFTNLWQCKSGKIHNVLLFYN